jgi:TRAP-type C4-dicarboxylate transport system permease small subunit
MKILEKTIDLAERICLTGSAVAVGAIMFLTVVDVILRKLTHHAVPSLYELTQDYFMVAMVFLSVSHVYRRGGHVRVTLFQGLIPRWLKTPLAKVLDLLVLCFFVVIGWAGWNGAAEAWEFREVSSSIMAYPLAPALFMVPLGCGLTAVRVVQSLFRPQSPVPDQGKS